MTRTNGLLNTISVVVALGAIVALIAGVDPFLTGIAATIGFAFALAVYWRQRPPGWPRNSNW